jgi:hypothetical protein
MTAQPNAYKHAAKAALKIWQLRDFAIETGLDAHVIDFDYVEEMAKAATFCRQLSEMLYERWQARGGKSDEATPCRSNALTPTLTSAISTQTIIREMTA